MRKAATVILILLAAVLSAAYFALPHYAPPYVEQLIATRLARFGVESDVRLKFGCCWRNGPGYAGDLCVSVPGTSWCVKAVFGASCSEWQAHVTMAETPFSEEDPLVRTLLAKFPLKGISNLSFSGTVALDAKAERTFGKPVAVWQAKAPLKDLKASMTSGEQEIVIDGLSVTPGASGVADHYDIAPMFLRAQSATVGGCCLTNFYATVRATEKSLMVNEAGAGFCGGRVNVYSLFLNPANLNTGFTLFLEDVDAGEALSHVNGFHGEASGRLHGKVKAFVMEGGKSIRLRDMFLYSTPGETGKLRMANPETVTENLAYAGIDDKTRANVSDALTDLDYRVLRFDLKRLEGKTARLTVQVSGTATRGETTVPVDLTINLNGEIEQLINTGLGYSAKLKGKKK